MCVCHFVFFNSNSIRFTLWIFFPLDFPCRLLFYSTCFAPQFSSVRYLYRWLSRSQNTIQWRNHLEIIFLRPGATVMAPPTETNRGNSGKHAVFWIRESKEARRNDFSMSLIVMWSHTEHIGAEIKVNSMSDLPLICIVTQSHGAGVYSWNILPLSTHTNKQETSRILYL